MAITVSRASYFKALASLANLETLYQAIPADKNDSAWIEFNSSQGVTEGDAIAVITQSAYSWTSAQMSALFQSALAYDAVQIQNPITAALGPYPNPLTKLGLYNKAIRHLGDRKLASLAENRESRRYLDDEYDGTVALCLRGGLWNWAMRAIKIDADSSIEPEFGYQSGFKKPNDWMRTSLVSTSETFDPPLRYYQDQQGFWLANTDTLYVRYVSSTLGLNLTVWPSDFAEYVGVALARTIAPRITQDNNLLDAIEQRELKYRKRAQANDAMDQPPSPWPTGTWVTNRIRRGVLPGLSNNIRYW